jgi:hypothetical protein
MIASSKLPRLTEQIIRNNIARNVEDLALPRLTWGVDEYFEMWGAAFPYEDDQLFILHPNSAISLEERELLLPLVATLNEAAEARDNSPQDILSSPWPAQIEELARKAYAAMANRGRFSEMKEEDEPSERFDRSSRS